MDLLLIVSVWVHVIAAAVWVGGMLLLALVVIPVTRQPDLRALGARFLSPLALRFRGTAWWALAVLGFTGAVNTVLRGIEPPDILTLRFFETTYGRTWALKLLLVGVALMLSYVHDFRLGPRLSALRREGAQTRETQALSRQVLLLARANVAVALAIVLLAVALPRGGVL